MKVSRLPQPLLWALVGAATFWIANVWLLYAINLRELQVPIYFGSRYLACAIASVPMALFGNLTVRGFGTLFVLPCIVVFSGYMFWNSDGSALWPPSAFADLLGFLPALIMFSAIKKRTTTAYLWY